MMRVCRKCGAPCDAGPTICLSCRVAYQVSYREANADRLRQFRKAKWAAGKPERDARAAAKAAAKVAAGEKICPKCQGRDFQPSGACKPCSTEWHRAYRKASGEHIKARDRSRIKTKGCPTCGGNVFSAWGKCRTCHAERERARRSRYAEAGRDKPCQTCGSTNFNASGACRPCTRRAADAARQRKFERDPGRWTVHLRMSKAVRQCLKRYLNTGKGGRSWPTFLGYDAARLAAHLKRTLPTGWTWQDFIDGRLHIDHKIPVSVHHFTSIDCPDFRRCWALKNLQLLPAAENLRKHAKMDRPFQPSLI